MNALYVRNETSLVLQITGGFAGEQTEEGAGQTVQMTDLRLEDGPAEVSLRGAHAINTFCSST